MIDLHLHTTASDGCCTPVELVRRARDAGVRTLSVTDHDTLAGLREAAAAAVASGLTFVPGIEITAVVDGLDVHILGYFLDASPPGLDAFLTAQRQDRLARLRAMAGRLATLGMPVNMDATLCAAEGRPGQSVGRPMLARALVDAGYVGSMKEAFDRWVGEGRPAFVPRRGPSPAAVVARITAAGGLASLAHPGVLRHDDLIPGLVAAGLGAIEAYHTEHDPDTQRRYVGVARAHEVAVSGGSDYHGEAEHRVGLGDVSLPKEEFDALHARLVRACAAARQ